MLNRFWSLSKNRLNPPHSLVPILPALNGEYQATWNANQDYIKNTGLFQIVFQVLKRYFHENFKNAPTRFFIFWFYIIFYISRCHLCNFLEFHSTLYEKYFCTKFSVFNGFKTPSKPQPLNGQNLLNMTKAFCQFSLKCLLKYFFFKYLFTKSSKAFLKCSKHNFSGLFFRTCSKNSCFNTNINSYW